MSQVRPFKYLDFMIFTKGQVRDKVNLPVDNKSRVFQLRMLIGDAIRSIFETKSASAKVSTPSHGPTGVNHDHYASTVHERCK